MLQHDQLVSPTLSLAQLVSDDGTDDRWLRLLDAEEDDAVCADDLGDVTPAAELGVRTEENR